MANFEDRMTQIRAEAIQRNKKAEQTQIARRDAQLASILKKIEDAHAKGERSCTIIAQIDRDVLRIVRSRCEVSPIKGYNPSTHDDMITGWTLKW